MSLLWADPDHDAYLASQFFEQALDGLFMFERYRLLNPAAV